MSYTFDYEVVGLKQITVPDSTIFAVSHLPPVRAKQYLQMVFPRLSTSEIASLHEHIRTSIRRHHPFGPITQLPTQL